MSDFRVVRMTYYVVIRDLNVLLGEEGILRLPSYIFDNYIMDDARREALERAFRYVISGENVLIVGHPGTGKTAFMAILLRRIISSGYQVAYILEGASSISREHEELGIILFYDDLPLMNTSALSSIFRNNVRNIVATARIEELRFIVDRVGFDPYEYFKIVEISPMAPRHLREMLLRYADAEGIHIVDRNAIDVVISKANGLPVYIWQVIRELRIRGEPLTLSFANAIPRGMYDYVDNILWRAIGNSEDRYETLLTLLCMTDFVKYLVNQDLYNAIFVTAKEKIRKQKFNMEEALYSDTLDRISRYLARDRQTLSFKLPHDSWADVLRGASSGPMSAEISKVNMLFPKSKRRELIIEAARRVWHEVFRLAEDAKRRNSFLENIRLNFGDNLTKDIIEKPPEKREVLPAQTIPSQSLILRQLRDYLRLGDAGVDLALKLAEGIIESGVDDPTALNAAAAAFLMKGIRTKDSSMIKKAINVLSKLNTFDAKYNLAIAYYHIGRFEDAEKIFRELYERHKEEEILFNLGVTLLRLGKFNDAIRTLETYVKLTSDPNAIRLLNRLKKLGIIETSVS